MQIIIMGAGNMARGIASRALSGGHTVQIIDREPDKAAQLAGLQEYTAAAAGGSWKGVFTGRSP